MVPVLRHELAEIRDSTRPVGVAVSAGIVVASTVLESTLITDVESGWIRLVSASTPHPHTRATASDKMAIFAYSRQRMILKITDPFFMDTQIPDVQVTIHHTSAGLSPNSQREDQEMRKYEPIPT